MKLLSFAFLAIVAIAQSLRCEPDSVFKIDCNTCRCSRNGEHALCTLKACIHFSDSSKTHVTRKSRSVEVPKALESEQMCEPGSTFQNYCNTCKCSADGKDAVCTLMDCDENIWNKDDDARNYEVTEEVPVLSTEHYEIEEYDEAMQFPDFLCTEVKSFNHYCNICTCSTVGHPPFCTMVGCSSKYWNEDGTRKSNVDEEFTIQPLLEEFTTVVSESEENTTEK